MKFEILVEEKGTKRQWKESYDKDVSDAKKWAYDTINHFNNTLEPGEKARKILRVILLNKSNKEFHNWGKSNLVTISKGCLMYDTYKCKNCGITGKRYGVSEQITIDSKFKAKLYEKCNLSMKKRGIKRTRIKSKRTKFPKGI